MYKKIKDYDFREIVGHFVLIRNIKDLVAGFDEEHFEKRIERGKQGIIESTLNHYKESDEYDETINYEDIFNMDALNEEMTTRKITELYEPIYGYFAIEKDRGFVLYILGNDEDKVKYVFIPTYCTIDDRCLDNVEVEIIDDYEFNYTIDFKDRIQDDEEQDEDVLKTRDLKELDMFRLKRYPDYVSCIIPFDNKNYNAKVKLQKFEEGIIYAKHYEEEGTLNIVSYNDMSFLVFKSTNNINPKKTLKDYINVILNINKKDYEIEDEVNEFLIQYFEKTIEDGFIKGDLPVETLEKIFKIIDEENQKEEE